MLRFDRETLEALKAEKSERETVRELLRENNELRQEIVNLRSAVEAYKEAMTR